jgi:plasmid maintenance system antidote protein VapI
MKNKKELTPEQQAEAHVYPHGLTSAEKTQADTEMLQMRLAQLGRLTESQRIYGGVLSLRYQMENYLSDRSYSAEESFGAYLRKYLHVVEKSQLEISSALHVHATRMNQIINDKLQPNLTLVYRLEKHSANLIPAHIWWALHAKQIEASIINDVTTRAEQGKLVQNAITI